MIRKRILQFILMLTLPFAAMSQVTNGTITGSVKTSDGKNLEGAAVTATHLPSGSVYTTISKKGGSFNLPGLRTGGPYKLKIDFVGLKSDVVEDFYIALGEPFNVNSVMQNDSKNLSEVVVATAKKKPTADRIGASTLIGQRQLTTLPTISRSITDFTRLTPQANGNSFAGRDGRYNNIQIDGANLNNNFGLSTDALPGGGAPISIDAIEELSVNISPFDVRQGAFTGAGINAITKSGTNTFHGSVYGLYRDQSYNGTNVKGTELTLSPSTNKTFGATIGGPIIKNKLFFFVSAEIDERSVPGIPWSPAGGSGAGNVSTVSKDSLQKLSDFLRTKGYETGAYDDFSNFITKSRRLLGKIDWNISKTNKLTLKYSDYDNEDDQQLNATSISFANAAIFSVRNGASNVNYSSNPNARFGRNAMSFQNSNYRFKNIVRTGTLELNSNFRGKFSNQFLATISKIKTTRSFDGGVFPFIEILNNNAQNYLSAGTDPFSNNNDVINDVYSVTNNFTYYAGKHTLTAGASYEYQRVGNMFMGASQSYYLFNSLNDLITNQAPAGYSLTYSLVPGQDAVYSADLKLGQFSAYIQDEININSRFKLIAGIRADQPIYLEQPTENPQITALTLPDANGNPTNYSTGRWPSNKMLFSPRVGFRWDVEGNKDLIVRGGSGIFTGRIPFVWLTNMPSNSAVLQANSSITSPAALQNYRFNPNPAAYRGNFPTSPVPVTPGSNFTGGFVVIDPNFKFPQVWRTNIAIDKQLGDGFSASFEAIFTKDINGVVMRNANERATDAKFTGSDSRPYFSVNSAAARRIYPTVTSAIVLENTNQGFTGTFTASLSKAATKGFYGSIAYNYSIGADVTSNPGSTAVSVWNNNATNGTQNSQQLYQSQNILPHRLVGNLSYRIEYVKHLATTIGIFFDVANQGSYTFVYNGDLNNDGNSASDLMYIPKDPSDIVFVNQAASGTVTARTAAEQSTAFFQLIENTPYLKDRKGLYAERNGALLPFFQRVDLRILQDIFTNIGKKRHTIQISADILNFPNLLNKNWGDRQQTVIRNPLIPAGIVNGQQTFRMTQVGGQLPTQILQTNNSTLSTWGMQLGIRYIF